MERQPIMLYMDCFKKKPNNKLYYKKIIQRKNQLNNNNNSYSIKKHINSSPDLLQLTLQNIKKNKNNKKNEKSTYNITLNPNHKLYKKIILPYININTVILIQKYVRGFIARKKLKKLKNNKKLIPRTENPKRFQTKLDLFDAIKRNSKNQKKSIKMANNKYNLRNTANHNKNDNKIYKKNIIMLNKDFGKKKNFSFDFNDNRNNKNKKNFETEFPHDIKINKNNNKVNIIKKNNYQNFSPDNEFCMSNFINEQSPQNIINNLENESNLLLENKQIFQTEGNINLNDPNIKLNNKNKKNLILPDYKTPSYFSSFQTKENTASDRNFTVENNNNFNLDNIHDKNNKNKKINSNTNSTTTLKNNINNINSTNTNNKNSPIKKNENNNSTGKNNESDIELYLKDEFDSDAHYQKNKNNFNLINNNIKYNFNPMLNSKIKLKNINHNKLPTITNKTFNDKCNYQPPGKFTTDFNLINNDKKIFEQIKEEKPNDNDLKSIKSSFYDEDEFVIINYDYTLNDKKKIDNLKIANVNNINIKGRKTHVDNFIINLNNSINKGIKLYIFNLLKNYKKEENDENEEEKSLTDNESCNYIPQGRIEKNDIIFNIAKNEMKSNEIIYNSNKDLNKFNFNILTNPATYVENETVTNKNIYSP